MDTQDKLGFEERLMAVLLGLMTLVTFINVPIRYLFDGVKLPRIEFLWAVEMTGFLFAWLVILGLAYCVKVSANLGVDVVIERFAPAPRRVIGLFAALACVIYALMMVKAGYDYWAPFANLPPTTGRWVPTGLATIYQPQGWYEVNDIPMPSWLGFLSNVFNDGDEYEKLPRVLPYAVMPFGMALLLWRFIQVSLRIWRGETDRLIVGHEAEEQVAEAAAKLRSEE
jgi:C4-dicarboxylate transporter DctQ subunit